MELQWKIVPFIPAAALSRLLILILIMIKSIDSALRTSLRAQPTSSVPASRIFRVRSGPWIRAAGGEGCIR